MCQLVKTAIFAVFVAILWNLFIRAAMIVATTAKDLPELLGFPLFSRE